MKVFQSLNIKKMALNKKDNIYWVYKNKNDFIEVEAESAFDAVRNSNIESPYKVKQASKVIYDLVIPSHLLTAKI